MNYKNMSTTRIGTSSFKTRLRILDTLLRYNKFVENQTSQANSEFEQFIQELRSEGYDVDTDRESLYFMYQAVQVIKNTLSPKGLDAKEYHPIPDIVTSDNFSDSLMEDYRIFSEESPLTETETQSINVHLKALHYNSERLMIGKLQSPIKNSTALLKISSSYSCGTRLVQLFDQDEFQSGKYSPKQIIIESKNGVCFNLHQLIPREIGIEYIPYYTGEEEHAYSAETANLVNFNKLRVPPLGMHKLPEVKNKDQRQLFDLIGGRFEQIDIILILHEIAHLRQNKERAVYSIASDREIVSEKDATFFALGTYRKMKQAGIDPCSDVENSTIIQLLEFAIYSHDHSSKNQEAKMLRLLSKKQ